MIIMLLLVKAIRFFKAIKAKRFLHSNSISTVERRTRYVSS